MNLMPTENPKPILSELDERRIEQLCKVFMGAINEHYVMGPATRERCLEVLNALAVSAAIVLNGCDGPHGNARKFFDEAFENQLKEGAP